MTFDLERARRLWDFLQDDCAEVGDVLGEMVAEIERLRADAKQSEIVIESRMELIDRQAYRIKKMEDALAEERARRNAHVDEDTWRYLERRKDVRLEEYLDDARQELQEEGKIGTSDHIVETG